MRNIVKEQIKFWKETFWTLREVIALLIIFFLIVWMTAFFKHVLPLF